MNQETEKTKMTKEELAKAWKNYYDWLDSIYSLKNFEIQGINGEHLNFYNGFNTSSSDNKTQLLYYYLRDDGYKEAFEKEKERDLLGEERDGENAGQTFNTKAFIAIDTETKSFNFGVNRDYHGHGYGTAIYDNYLHILEMLDVEDREQYELRVHGNPNHDFFKRIHTKELVAKTNGEPNAENALQVLKEFAKYPNPMKFSELNTIVEYAINSGVSIKEIAEAINYNGFNIFYSTINSIPDFEENELKQFKSFGITGLKATCMHHHFMKGQNFGFIQLLDDIDMQDATLEFKRIFEGIKEKTEKGNTEGIYISPNLEKFGELEYIILDWDYSGLLFKSVSPDIQKLVKKQAISKFDEFDPEHRELWPYDVDSNSAKTLRMLSDAGLMDKDAYIALYQKALNRNYDLEEFDKVLSIFISNEERKKAQQEISQNVYYPSPKGIWQKSYSLEKNHRISKIEIPQEVSKKGNIRDLLKQELLRQQTAKKTKIKTDMTGIGRDGKPFIVDNLKDWLFGVPGAHGNLQMIGTTAIVLPPQTPQFAVDLIEKTLNGMAYPPNVLEI